MIFTYKKSQPYNKGFTLIEALVSLGLFSIVVVAASGVILSIINSNKKNQAISSVVNNLNYSIESMVRDIKTGYGYQCGNILDTSQSVETSPILLRNFKLLAESCDGVTPVSHITLVSTITGKEQVVRYMLVGTGEDAYIEKTIYSEEIPGTIMYTPYPLTSINNISIKRLGFIVTTPPPPSLVPKSVGPLPPPSQGPQPAPIIPGQPSVFFTLIGTTKLNQINVSDFFIQTFISQRLPNFI